jgi:hypothetical protein
MVKELNNGGIKGQILTIDTDYRDRSRISAARSPGLTLIFTT